MAARTTNADGDWLKLQECVEGNSEALTFLRNKYHSRLRTLLVARGASPAEADDLLADLWGDCVAGTEDRPSLLEKFSGNCPIKAWLITVATHRLYDLKRKQRLRAEPFIPHQNQSSSGFSAHVAAPPSPVTEGALIDLLRESLQKAFTLCPADKLLMLQLVHLHGLSQREIGRMWGWHESKVSRSLAREMSGIRTHTLERMKHTDPWMEITWQDFLDLCETHQIGFL